MKVKVRLKGSFLLLSCSDPSVIIRLHRDPEGSAGSAESAGPGQRSRLPGSCEFPPCGAADSAPHGDQRLVALTLRLLIPGIRNGPFVFCLPRVKLFFGLNLIHNLKLN